MTAAIDKISTDQKVEMIFTYLFDGKKSEEEERFWNVISEKEIKELQRISTEETVPFSSVKEHA